MELYELFQDFPVRDDPRFAGKISAKTEFRELAMTADSDPVVVGQLFRSQQVVRRLLAPNSTIDEMLAIHEAGAGKTCAAVAVAEAYKHGRIGPGQKRALVVVSGDTVEQSFKDNLAYVCTAGEYLPPTDRRYTAASRRGAVTTRINEYYEFWHIIGLAKKIATMSDADIHEYFSGRVMIFDESHRLRMGYQSTNVPARSNAMSEEEREMHDARVYERIWQMLHLAERRKILFLTATPIIDRPEELGMQVNLLNPADRQLINYDWNDPQLAELEPYFRGLISYVQSSTNVPPARHQGELITVQSPFDGEEDVLINLRLVTTEMSEEQFDVYQRYAEGQAVPGPGQSEQAAFRRDERYAAMFLFPLLPEESRELAAIAEDPQLDDEERERRIDAFMDARDAVGTSAFNRRVEVTRSGDFRFRPESGMEQILREGGLEMLEVYSSKFARIIREVAEHPTENAYIYTEFVKAPGALLLGLCFEALGYERFTGGTLQGLAPGRRYAVLTSLSSAAYIKDVLAIFRAPENRYGDYIQAVIGSNVTREGLSYLNTRQVHIAHPFWNNTPMYQGIRRAFRENGHAALPPEERYVKVFLHAAIGPGRDYNTIDMQMYARAEAKNRRNARVMRIAKMCAIDCAIARERNQGRGEDFTSDCDYDTCRYDCVGVDVDAYGAPLSPVPADDSSYFLYYSEEYLATLKEELRRLFLSASHLELAEITAALLPVMREQPAPPGVEADRENSGARDGEAGSDGGEEKYLLRALNELVRHHEELTTEFGQTAYLKVDGDAYYLQYEIAHGAPELSTYTRMLTAAHGQTLQEFLLPYQEEETLLAVTDYERIPPDDPALPELLVAENEKVKARLVETALATPPAQRTAFQWFTLEFFQGRWYEVDTDPLTGQPALIYFHDILAESGTDPKYTVTTKSAKNANRTRLLQDGEWRTVDGPIEASAYFQIIKDVFTARRDVRDERSKVYGIVSTADGEFRLVDNIAGENKHDGRKVNRSRMCGDFDKKDLINIMRYLRIPPPVPTAQKENTRADITRRLNTSTYKKTDFSDYSDEDVQTIYLWTLQTRDNMCRMIRDYLHEHNLVYRD